MWLGEESKRRHHVLVWDLSAVPHADKTGEGLPYGEQFVPFFSGRPQECFAALDLEFPGNDLPEMIQRQHKRDKGETSSETLALTLR
jgi:hypothetical protein